MQIKIEFATHKTPRFPFLVRLCKRFPSYKVEDDAGLIIHSMEFTEKESKSFEAIHKILYGLPQVAYFIDGALVPQGEIFSLIRDYESKRRMDGWAAKQQERERMRAFFHRNPSSAFLARLKRHGLFGNDN